MTSSTYPRDLRRYGRTRPDPKWPANAPLVVQGLKKLAREVMPKGPLETVAHMRRLLDPIRGSEDFKEDARAFRKKHMPDFRGN